MADEPIGEIPVLITGDYSALTEALTQAQAAASAAGGQIAAAFNQAQASIAQLDPGELNLFDQALRGLQASGSTTSEALGLIGAAGKQLGDNVAGAADQLRGAFAPAIHESGDAVEGFGGGMEHAAEQGSIFEGLTSRIYTRMGPLGESIRLAKEDVVELGEAFAAFEAIKQAIELSEMFEVAMRTIVGDTGAAGEKLDSLRESFEQVFVEVPAGADQVASVIGTLAAKLDLTGEALDSIAKQVIDLSRLTGESVTQLASATATVFQQWNVAEEQQKGTLDFFLNVAQAAGISVTAIEDSVTRFGATLREFGLSISDAALLVGELGKAGVPADQAMASLQRSLLNLAKAGVDPKEALADLQGAIQGASTEAEAFEIGAKVFGRGAAAMTEAIREGKVSLTDFQGALVLGNETIESQAARVQNLSDSWHTLVHTFEEDVLPIAEYFTGVAQGMVNILGDVEQGTVQLGNTVKQVFAPWIDLLAGVGQGFVNLYDDMARVIGLGGSAAPSVSGSGEAGAESSALADLTTKTGDYANETGKAGAASQAFNDYLASLTKGAKEQKLSIDDSKAAMEQFGAMLGFPSAQVVKFQEDLEKIRPTLLTLDDMVASGFNLDKAFDGLVKLRDEMAAAGLQGTATFTLVQGALDEVGTKISDSGTGIEKIAGDLQKASDQGAKPFTAELEKINAALDKAAAMDHFGVITAEMIKLDAQAQKNNVAYQAALELYTSMQTTGTHSADAVNESLKQVEATAKRAGVSTVDLVAALQAATTGGVIPMNAALTLLGITADGLGAKAAADLMLIENELKRGSASVGELDALFGKLQGDIKAMAGDPAGMARLIADMQTNIDQLVAMHAPLSVILADKAALLQAEIDYAEQTGTDATAQIVALTNIKEQQQALIDSTTLLGDAYKGLMKTFNDLFTQTGKAIADNIVDEKNWGDVGVTVAKNLAKEILENLVGTAFKALENAIKNNTGLLNEMAKVFNGIFSGGGGGGGIGVGIPSLGGLGGASGNVPVFGGGPTLGSITGPISAGADTGASAASGATSALGSVTGIIGAIGSIGSMITGAIGDVMQAHTNTLLDHIELNTRETAMFIGGFGGGGLTDFVHDLVVYTHDLDLAFTGTYLSAFASLMGTVETIRDDMKGPVSSASTGDAWFQPAFASLMGTVEDIDALLKRAGPASSPAAATPEAGGITVNIGTLTIGGQMQPAAAAVQVARTIANEMRRILPGTAVIGGINR